MLAVDGLALDVNLAYSLHEECSMGESARKLIDSASLLPGDARVELIEELVDTLDTSAEPYASDPAAIKMLGSIREILLRLRQRAAARQGADSPPPAQIKQLFGTLHRPGDKPMNCADMDEAIAQAVAEDNAP